MAASINKQRALPMNDRIYRKPQVCELTGLAASTIYEKVREGTFPKPVKLGPRASGWKASDIEKFIAGLRPADDTEAA